MHAAMSVYSPAWLVCLDGLQGGERRRRRRRRRRMCIIMVVCSYHARLIVGFVLGSQRWFFSYRK
jgi:hypothetical protein